MLQRERRERGRADEVGAMGRSSQGGEGDGVCGGAAGQPEPL